MTETRLPEGVRAAPESATAPIVRALTTLTIGDGLIARVGETFRADDPRVLACPDHFIAVPDGGLTDGEFAAAVRELERDRTRARQAKEAERRAREAAEDEKRRKKIAKRAEQIARERERQGRERRKAYVAAAEEARKKREAQERGRERRKAYVAAAEEARKKREAQERERERQAREQELERHAWAASERSSPSAPRAGGSSPRGR